MDVLFIIIVVLACVICGVLVYYAPLLYVHFVVLLKQSSDPRSSNAGPTPADPLYKEKDHITSFLTTVHENTNKELTALAHSRLLNEKNAINDEYNQIKSALPKDSIYHSIMTEANKQFATIKLKKK